MRGLRIGVLFRIESRCFVVVMSGGVRVVIHDSQMYRMLDKQGLRILLSHATRVARVAKQKAPRESGRLQQSINIRTGTHRGKPAVAVGSDLEYAAFVHQGTGLYGPHRTPIKPRSARYMVFMGRDGNLVFAKQVIGQPARPFLTEAMDEVFRRGAKA